LQFFERRKENYLKYAKNQIIKKLKKYFKSHKMSINAQEGQKSMKLLSNGGGRIIQFIGQLLR